jgi:hypothetical protein
MVRKRGEPRIRREYLLGAAAGDGALACLRVGAPVRRDAKRRLPRIASFSRVVDKVYGR